MEDGNGVDWLRTALRQPLSQNQRFRWRCHFGMVPDSRSGSNGRNDSGAAWFDEIGQDTEPVERRGCDSRLFGCAGRKTKDNPQRLVDQQEPHSYLRIRTARDPRASRCHHAWIDVRKSRGKIWSFNRRQRRRILDTGPSGRRDGRRHVSNNEAFAGEIIILVREVIGVEVYSETPNLS